MGIFGFCHNRETPGMVFKCLTNKIFEFLGNISFGIYFSHIAVIKLLGFIPAYAQFAFYPLNAVIVIIVNSLLIVIGKKVLGKHSRYLAL